MSDTVERSSSAALTELTSEIVSAYVAHNAMPAADVPALIAMVHATLSGLGRSLEAVPEPQKPVPAVSVRKSVTDSHLISLEDGKPYQALKRHLTKLDMTPDSYRAKWGLPADYPMVAPAYSRARSALAKDLGLGSRMQKR